MAAEAAAVALAVTRAGVPAITEGKSGRILAHWRRELPPRAGMIQHA